MVGRVAAVLKAAVETVLQLDLVSVVADPDNPNNACTGSRTQGRPLGGSNQGLRT
jgi:hypothetical protein